jgi:glycosyltransferase involved in cell wall biosynthesis
MKLSILTPTIPERCYQSERFEAFSDAGNLAYKIENQIGSLPVEHLLLCDNKSRSIGAKRQALLDIARGQYIAFVDDDDDISNDYVQAILAGIATGADVITFHQRAIYNGLESEVHFNAANHDEPFTPGRITKRAPWHVCAWRRDLVAECVFGESNYGEDLVWARQARRRIRTAHHIPRILHTYRHDASTTAAPEN